VPTPFVLSIHYAAVPACAAAFAALQRLAVNTLHHTEAQGRPTHPEALHIQVHLGVPGRFWARATAGVIGELFITAHVSFCLLFVSRKATQRTRNEQEGAGSPYAHPYGMEPTAAAPPAAASA